MRYVLPANAEAMSAQQLIAHEREQAGVTPYETLDSAGAMALATWLLSNPARTLALSMRANSPLSMGYAVRQLLCGTIFPSDPLAESIARMTEGAVLPATWSQAINKTNGDRAEAGDTAYHDPGRASASGEAMLSASPHPRSTAMGAEDVAGALPIPQPGAPVTMGIDLASPDGDMTCVAVLGETPPGPLFRVIPPTRRHPFYEVHGLALSFRVGESGARALHAALGTAIGVAPGSPA